MVQIDVEALLAPVTEASPCGEDLEYNAAFLALEDAARGKPEQEYGNTLIPAQEPDWRAMQSLALDLGKRTRDLRVAMMLLRGATRLEGMAGFVPSVRLLHGLLERHWDGVYPLLDASDHDDPTMRLNALAPLSAASGVLADLRAASIGPVRNGLTARSIELALGKGEARPGETVMTEARAVQALSDAEAAEPGLLAGLAGAHDAVKGIQVVLDARAGAANGPDLQPLRALTQCLAQAAGAARGESIDAVADVAVDASGGAATARAATGTIASRDDAIKSLDRICEWLERSEPSNPAPLLIRRAQRLMSKSFIDIIRDLAPDGLKEVERIAGVTSP